MKLCNKTKRGSFSGADIFTSKVCQHGVLSEF